jgi:predicted TIM-barrel fold metal-dependent hydrolase
MKIDVFCHFLPPKYLEARSKKATGGWAITRGALWARTLPAIVDLEARFRIMDRYEDYFQVLSIAAPPVEKVVKPEDAVELSKIANDELAELVLKYPDRFVAAVACLPMNHVDAALDEIDRGILEKYPTLKFLTHHAGGTIPFLQARIQAQGDAQEMRFGDRYEVHLTKKITDYLRMFYCDTAVCGDTLPLMCARGFFGIEHLLFATDMPFDVQGGLRLVRETIRSVDDMDIPEAERKMIYFDNAMKLFRLPV